MAALFALLLRLTLGFGHVHDRDDGAVAAGPPAGATSPASHDHRHPADRPHDICAICVASGLLASAPLPPPLTPLPPSVAACAPAVFAAALAALTPRLAFRSRAPPIA